MLSKDATSAEFDVWKAEILCRAKKEAGMEERRAARLRAVLNAVVDQHHDIGPERQEEIDWHHAPLLRPRYEYEPSKNTEGEGENVIFETSGCQKKRALQVRRGRYR
jgi:hypothetical protein